MYEKDIDELKKQIEKCKRSIKRGNDDIKQKAIVICTIIPVATLLGGVLGTAMNHPILMGIMGFSVASMGAITIYQNGIVPDKNLVEGAKLKIKEHETDIKKMEEAQTKSLTKEVKLSDKKEYSFNKDRNNLTDKDMDDMIGYFEDLNNPKGKGKK